MNAEQEKDFFESLDHLFIVVPEECQDELIRSWTMLKYEGPQKVLLRWIKLRNKR